MLKNIFPRLAVVSAIILGFSNTAIAAPFSVTWNTTMDAGSDAPYIPGEALSVTIVLDNGGTDAISQTWGVADLVSVTYEINNGAITTVFGNTGLNLTSGSFVTDASGVLTAVPSAWGNFSAPIPVISTNDPRGPANLRWVLNGINYVYAAFAPFASANSVAPANNILPGFWTNPVALNPAPTPGAPAAIPTLSAYGLGLMALALMLIARRKLPA